MNTLTPELKRIMTQQNLDFKGDAWKTQIEQRKQHHMRSYLKMVLIKLQQEDNCHAASNMQTQNLLRDLTQKYFVDS